MVHFCSIRGCKSTSGQGIKMHRLPKNKELRSKWIASVCYHSLKYILPSTSYICELHFKNEDYYVPLNNMYNTVQLKKDAIPSVFNKKNTVILFPYTGLSTSTNNNIIEVIDDYFLYHENVQGIDLKVDNVNIPNTSQQSDHCSVQSDISVSPENVLINNKDPLMILPTNSKKKQNLVWEDLKTVDDNDTSNNCLKDSQASHNVIKDQKKK